MRDRQHCYHLVIIFIRDHQNDGAGAIFQPFFLAALMFGLPQIGIADDLTG